MSKDARYMQRLGELLVFHEIINRPEDLTEDNFDDTIMAFQEKADILVDGDPRWETLWYLQYPWVLQFQKLPSVRCGADKINGIEGFDHLMLRKDAAEKYNAVRQEVLDRGGVITTSGGNRPLTQKASAGRSSTSMHYPGLAFDLALVSGFFKPDTDPFVITRGENGYWVVWCRADRGDEEELNAVYWEGWNSGIDLGKTVRGKFINFTEICAKHGFYPIRARKGFTRPENRGYISCEWWHFQANDLLIPELSQFGIELLKIEGYSPEHIRTTSENVWSRRRVIYRINWS